MDASKILRDHLNEQPEHPVPYAGDVVHLVYPPKAGTVGVTVATRSDFIATLTIAVPAAELEAAIAEARIATVRNLGLAPEAPAALENAREQLGTAVFDERVGNMVRLAFLSAAMMRTGVFPFLTPQILASGPFVPGEDYSFQARLVLRPRAGLTDYAAPAVKKPAHAQVEDDAVNERMNQMIGGNVPWDQVSPERSASVEGLRSQVREALELEADAAWHDAVMNAAVDELVKRLDADAPTRHIELLRDSMANAYASDLVASGVDWDAYTAAPTFSMDDFKNTMTYNAIVSLNRGMALDALAEHLDVRLTFEDVLAAAGQVAPGHEAEAIRGMLQTGQLPQLVEVSRRLKAGDWLVRNCKEA